MNKIGSEQINQNRDFITAIFTWLVCLICTILGHITFPFTDMYFTTVLVGVVGILILFFGITNGINISWNWTIALYVVVLIYGMIRGKSFSLDSLMPFITIIICVQIGTKNFFDIHYARKILETIALVAVILLFIQLISYYLFNAHLQLIPQSWLPEESIESYGDYLSTGISSGEYRPASIFLEPSHFVQYLTVALISVLFPEQEEKVNIKKALMMSLGMILTVSSTGWAMVIIVWCVYALFNIASKESSSRITYLFLIPIIVVIILFFSSSNSTIGYYFQRILPSNIFSSVSNQEERFWAMRYLNDFSSKEWLLGRGVGTEPTGFYTGYTRTMYRMGILGVFSVYMMVIDFFIHSNRFSKCLCIAFALMFYVAEFDVYKNMIFYFVFIYAYYTSNKRKFLIGVKLD